MTTEESESALMRRKYKDRIPVICMPGKVGGLPALSKNKFLVPRDFTVGQFIYLVRKRIKLQADSALFFLVDSTIPSVSTTMGDLDQAFRFDDGFLYLVYSGESVYG